MQPSPSPSITGFESPSLDPLVIALVCIFCTVFLVFSYYRMIQQHWCVSNVRWFSRRYSNSNQPRRINDQILDDPNLLRFQSIALDSFVMHSLPVVQFQKNKEEGEGEGEGEGSCHDSDTDCAVCLGEFEEGEWVKHLPNCSHFFHVFCIDTWFQTHSSCPLCRSYICLEMPQEHVISMDSLLESSSIRDDSEYAINIIHSN